MKALKETELGQEYVDSKMGRIDQACQRYGLGRNMMRKLAAEAGAVRQRIPLHLKHRLAVADPEGPVQRDRCLRMSR